MERVKITIETNFGVYENISVKAERGWPISKQEMLYGLVEAHTELEGKEIEIIEWWFTKSAPKQSKMPKIEKLELGIMPREIWNDKVILSHRAERMDALKGAIERRLNSRHPILPEWIAEWNEWFVFHEDEDEDEDEDA